jgi:hypothetical protein
MGRIAAAQLTPNPSPHQPAARPAEPRGDDRGRDRARGGQAEGGEWGRAEKEETNRRACLGSDQPCHDGAWRTPSGVRAGRGHCTVVRRIAGALLSLQQPSR